MHSGKPFSLFQGFNVAFISDDLVTIIQVIVFINFNAFGHFLRNPAEMALRRRIRGVPGALSTELSTKFVDNGEPDRCLPPSAPMAILSALFPPAQLRPRSVRS
jgi:hypothetical protein